MKYTQYISLIKKLENFAAENPRGYEMRVVALGVLGYAYFGLIIFLFFAIPLFIVAAFWFFPTLIWFLIKAALKLIWVIVLGLAAILGFLGNSIRSLWTKIPEPEGIELNGENAPELTSFVKTISEKLKTPLPEKVLLVEEYNAAVMTLPRFGMFGKKVFLLVGLPLMQAVSPEQFEAVIAHEFGHISRRHGKYAAWIYRVHETWERFLALQEQQEHALSFLYAKFVNWYFPYFSAYAFVLMRRHEREADQYAVELFGAKPLGEALINTEIKGISLTNDFWQKILDDAAHDEKPPQKVFSQMALAFRNSDRSADQINLAKAVAVSTDYQDSHPALSERLKLIGYWNGDKNEIPALPEPAEKTAADRFFGERQTKDFAAIFDSAWQTRVEQDWKLRYERLLEIGKRIDELEKKENSLTADELYEKAVLTAERFGEEKSLPLFEELVRQNPENPNANFTLGALLLNEDREEGIEFLDAAKELNAAFKASSDEVIYNYLRRNGRDAEAEKYLFQIEEQQEIIELARQERANVSPTENFEEPNLPAEKIEIVRQTVSYHEEIQAAYLVRKHVRYLPEIPFHILFLDVKIPRFRFGGVTSENVLEAVANKVGDYDVNFVVVLEKDFKNAEENVSNVKNSKIY